MPLTKIPKSLQSLRQWINWKMVHGDGDSPKKLPVTQSGKAASSTDPSTWTDFETASAAASRFSGVGYVFEASDPFCGIDFDGCRNPGTSEVAEWAKQWIVKLDSYSEVSPSGTGVKVWVRAKWPLPNGKKRSLDVPRIVPGRGPAVEVYDHSRYFCATGDRMAGLPDEPQDRQAVIDEICRTWFAE